MIDSERLATKVPNKPTHDLGYGYGFQGQGQPRNARAIRHGDRWPFGFSVVHRLENRLRIRVGTLQFLSVAARPRSLFGDQPRSSAAT
jgi:hypothetical protein